MPVELDFVYLSGKELRITFFSLHFWAARFCFPPLPLATAPGCSNFRRNGQRLKNKHTERRVLRELSMRGSGKLYERKIETENLKN
ncbi:hypothetical protein VTK26DRAFT_4084 [Humicola hyalothermophila]